MAQADSSITTDLSGAPTLAELDAMVLAHRRAEQEAADYAEYERYRASAHAPIRERAAEDAIRYGEAA